MVNMKNGKKPKSNEIAYISEESEDYPYGLRISLNSSSLKKLGMTALPQTGVSIKFEAKAKVVSTSQTASKGESERQVELQITDMEFEDNDKEDVTRDQKGSASKLAKKMAYM